MIMIQDYNYRNKHCKPHWCEHVDDMFVEKLVLLYKLLDIYVCMQALMKCNNII